MNASSWTAPSPYTLPDLPYAYEAFDPIIGPETMRLHHDKHHAAYVKAANETVERLDGCEAWQLPGLLSALAFNVGGHLLHSQFWNCLSPEPTVPQPGLQSAVEAQWKTVDAFVEQFTAAITTLSGAGWAVLSFEPNTSRLVIQQVHDHQGSIICDASPIIVADAWEHAYYLDHRNDKAKWAESFFSVLNWDHAERQFTVACSKGL